MRIQNLLIFFGGPLQCDSPILEALFFRLRNPTIQDIWNRLPENYSLADPIKPVLDRLRFCSEWEICSSGPKYVRACHEAMQSTDSWNFDIRIFVFCGKIYFYQKRLENPDFTTRLTFLPDGSLKKAQIECITRRTVRGDFLDEAKEISSLKKLLIFANEKLALFE